MKLVITGPASLVKELTGITENVKWVVTENAAAFETQEDAEAFFDLHPEATISKGFDYSSPLFINSVANSCNGQSFVRINAWPGFLSHSTWEVSGNITLAAKKVLEKLGKSWIVCPDIPGFISAGVIAMIINEAYFALQEEVSSKADIDTAMKLGTNYPYGPFEWSEIIGIKNVYTLLCNMSKLDKKYVPAPNLALQSAMK